MKKTRFTVYGDDSVEIRYPDGKQRLYKTIGGQFGYVYDVTRRRFGSLGRQVSDPRALPGSMLSGPEDSKDLADLLRKRLKLARRKAAKGEIDPRYREMSMDRVKL
jgi:hypothetical protein